MNGYLRITRTGALFSIKFYSCIPDCEPNFYSCEPAEFIDTTRSLLHSLGVFHNAAVMTKVNAREQLRT